MILFLIRYLAGSGRSSKEYWKNESTQMRSPLSGGLEGRSRPLGLRIKMKITWQGRVIDTANGSRIIDTRHWGVDRDDVIV